MRTLLEALLALAAAALWPVAALAAEALAMVTDVQGRVLLAPGRAAVEILAELPADAAVELAPGARLTLVYVKGGAEYEVSGPGSARLAAAGPAVAGGAKLQAKDRLPDVYRDVKLKPARLAQASMVMRGARPGATLKLVSPVGTLVTTPSPTFRWEPVAGATAYRLQLADAAGQVVFAREVDKRTKKDARLTELERALAEPAGADRAAVRARLAEVTEIVRSEKLGEVAAEYDRVHDVARAQRVGSVHEIIPAARLRPWLIEALERGMAKALSGTR